MEESTDRWYYPDVENVQYEREDVLDKLLEEHQLRSQFLLDVANTLNKKTHDYSKVDDTFFTFESSGRWVNDAVERGVHGTKLVFIALLAVKFSRLINLLGAEDDPMCESVRDTLIDIAGYVTLLNLYLQKESS